MASRINVEVVSHTDEFMQSVVDRMPSILKAIGQTAEGYAKQDCPVDTGLLHNSITFAISGEAPQISTYSADKPDETGVVRTGSYEGNTEPETEDKCYSLVMGSNVVYAPIQEMSDEFHHTVGKAHFLRDAMQNHREDYKDIIEAAILSLPGANGN